MTDIAELRRLLGAATPGPWEAAHSFRGIYSQNTAPGPVQICRVPENYDWPHKWRANASLIVAAVNALPSLLERLEKAERDAARYRAVRDMCCSPLGPSNAVAMAWMVGDEAATDAAIDSYMKEPNHEG